MHQIGEPQFLNFISPFLDRIPFSRFLLDEIL
jgi:hypothetical protein